MSRLVTKKVKEESQGKSSGFPFFRQLVLEGPQKVMWFLLKSDGVAVYFLLFLLIFPIQFSLKPQTQKKFFIFMTLGFSFWVLCWLFYSSSILVTTTFPITFDKVNRKALGQVVKDLKVIAFFLFPFSNCQTRTHFSQKYCLYSLLKPPRNSLSLSLNLKIFTPCNVEIWGDGWVWLMATCIYTQPTASHELSHLPHRPSKSEKEKKKSCFTQLDFPPANQVKKSNKHVTRLDPLNPTDNVKLMIQEVKMKTL